MNRQLAANFVKYVAVDVLTQNEDGAYLEATLDVANLQDSTYSAIQSAIFFLCWNIVIERPVELRGVIGLYWKGSKRKVRQLNQDLGIDIS